MRRIIVTSLTVMIALLLGAPVHGHDGPREQVALLSQQLTREPSRADLYLRRGELQREAGDLTAARADLARAGTLEVTLPGLALAWARLQLDERHPVRAIDTGAPQQFDDQVLSLTSVSALPLPGAFAKTSPKNAAKNLATSVALAWGASTNTASYEFCVDTSNNSSCDSTWVNTGATLANSGTWWKFTTAR